MFNNIKFIIFDLDDTLFDEKKFRVMNIKKILSFFLLRKINSNYKINKFIKFNYLQSKIYNNSYLTNLSKKLSIKVKKNDILELFNSTPKEKYVSQEDILLLKLLKKKKIKIGLITDGNYIRQFNKIYDAGIIKLFDKIIINSSEKKKKPNKLSFKKMLSYYNVNPNQALYVGDNPNKDFLGPKSLGIKTIRVFKGKYKHLKKNKFFEADKKINKLTDLKKIL
mgnify:FL=1|tara:strand:- start:174 stop:842 length:669 start_codon:yes stop_codon:yes gene_type:complete